MSYDPAIDLHVPGWIPPDLRNTDQMIFTNQFDRETPSFTEANGFAAASNLPDEAILAKLEIKVLGKPMPRIHQRSGSCVGAGGWQAYGQATIGDIAVRGDNEAPDWCFPWATYGVGRRIGGMRGTGEGSFGAAQARAVKEWGMVPLIGNGVPAGRLTDSGWLVWDSRTEVAWSHPNGWPRGAYEDLTAVAERNQIQTVSRIRSTDEAASALAQGYGITLASMFGTRDERVVEGFLLASWSSRWAHQMSCGGYAQHPSRGRIFWIQNQWGPQAHPSCPYMSALGVRGGFWITSDTFGKIISSGEVFAHSNTEGFPPREIVWRNPVL